jgi:hypothetical protein
MVPGATAREMLLRCGNRYFTRIFTACGTGKNASPRPIKSIAYKLQRVTITRITISLSAQ